MNAPNFLITRLSNSLPRFKPLPDPLLHRRNTALHPLRHRGVQQIVVEELLHAPLEVFFVLRFLYSMGIAIVVKQPGGLAQAAQRYEELDALVPGHGAVVVIVQNEDGRFNPVGVE